MRSPRRPFLAYSVLAALACCALASAPALAHAPAEVWHIVSTARDDVVLATNRGLIFGNLDTRTFTLLCNEAFDVGTSVAYRAAKLPSGRLMVATIDGLLSSDDRGCTWTESPALLDASTPFLVQHPSIRERVYVSSFSKSRGGVMLTSDGGATVTTLLSTPDDEYIGSLLLAPGALDTLYAAIQRFPAQGDFQFFVTRSSDGGTTWERTEVALTSDERDLQLLAVNPLFPAQLVVRVVGAEPIMGERVLFSRDGGKTFTAALTARAVTSATFSKDGKAVLVAGVDGVQRADIGDGALSFVPAGASARISSLLQADEQRLASGYYQGIDAARDGVGIAEANSTDFTHWLDFNEVQTAASCPAPSTVQRDCASLFHDWQIENPPPRSDDAGVSDGGVSDGDADVPDGGLAQTTDAGGGDAAITPVDAGDAGPRTRGSDGCSLTANTRTTALTWSAPLLALVLVRRRRGPHTRQRG